MIDQNRVERNSYSERITPHREPVDLPPPYSPIDVLHGPAVITSQPVIHQTIIVQTDLKAEPLLIDCPSCHKRCMTKVDYANSQKTHMLAGFVCGLTM